VMKGWWIPTLLACAAHGAFSALPVQIGAPQKAKKTDVAFQFSPPPPPPPTKPPDVKPAPLKPVRKLKKRVVTKPPLPPEVEEEPEEEPVEEAVEAPNQEAVAEAPVQAEPVMETPRPKYDLRVYGKQIHDMVIKHRRYPRAARRLGLEGKVYVKISVLRNGELAENLLCTALRVKKFWIKKPCAWYERPRHCCRCPMNLKKRQQVW